MQKEFNVLRTSRQNIYLFSTPFDIGDRIHADIETHQVNGQGYDSNVYLVMSANAPPIIIDTGTGLGRLFENMVASIERHTPLEDIATIILTHSHFDHTGGANKLKALTGADVYVHPQDIGPLLRADNVVTGARAFGGELEPLEARPLGAKLELDDTELEVVHTPGHTEGSVSLYEPATRSLFTGDLIFTDGGFGRYDLIGGDGAALHRSVLNVARLDVTNLYPGHGPYAEGDGMRHIRLALEEMGRWL